MQRKKIVVDICYLLVAQTGVRTYTEELINQINKFQIPQHDYIILPNFEKIINNNYFRGNTPKLKNLLFHLYYFWWKQVRLPILAKKAKADVILSPDYLSPIWKTSSLKIPVIHDAFFWENPEYYNKWWLIYFRWMMLKGLRGHSLVVTTTQYSLTRLKPLLPPGQACEVVYQGSKFEKIEKTDGGILQQYRLKNGGYFLFLGVMEKRKNIITLLKAFKIFLTTGPGQSIKLVLAGQRGTRTQLDDYPNIIKTIDELGLQNHVMLPGYVSKQDAIALFDNALCFVFPSANEGFGLPVLEAFSRRTPVIASSNGALLEVGGDAIVSFDTFDVNNLAAKLIQIHEDRSLREQLISKGLQRLQVFSWERFFVSLEEVISRHA